MPTNYTVSIQMKIEPFLLSQLEGGPQCKSLRLGPFLWQKSVRWAPKCEFGPSDSPSQTLLLPFPIYLDQIGRLRSRSLAGSIDIEGPPVRPELVGGELYITL